MPDSFFHSVPKNNDKYNEITNDVFFDAPEGSNRHEMNAGQNFIIIISYS